MWKNIKTKNSRDRCWGSVGSKVNDGKPILINQGIRAGRNYVEMCQGGEKGGCKGTDLLHRTGVALKNLHA